MQKFEFKAVIYAKSMEEAKIEMRENMVRQQGIHGSMLNAFECTHVVREGSRDKAVDADQTALVFADYHVPQMEVATRNSTAKTADPSEA